MFFVKGTSEEHVILKGKMACSSAYIQGGGGGAYNRGYFNPNAHRKYIAKNRKKLLITQIK